MGCVVGKKNNHIIYNNNDDGSLIMNNNECNKSNVDKSKDNETKDNNKKSIKSLSILNIYDKNKEKSSFFAQTILSFKDKNLLLIKSLELEQIQAFEKKLTMQSKMIGSESQSILKIFPSTKEGDNSNKNLSDESLNIQSANFTQYALKSKLINPKFIKKNSSNTNGLENSVKDTIGSRDIYTKLLNSSNSTNSYKKYFIYQLRRCFLLTKKDIFNKSIMSNIDNCSRIASISPMTPTSQMGISNMPYYDMITNYSQTSISSVDVIEKYEDQSIKINNYIIYKNKLLGKGSFSSVYLALNLNDNKNYAIKITDKFTRANSYKTKYEYVKDEIVILRRLSSKYVVKTYEIIENKTQTFIVMDYMKNKSLLDNISCSKLDEYKIWKYFRNLICAVEHCHEIAKIVHRDISPSNLLISDDDILKLSDFGVSVIISQENDNISNTMPSTYNPPEKENKLYSGKSADIWLMGITLYHMIHKKSLIKMKKIPEIIEDEIDTSIDSNLRILLLRLLDKNPDKRYKLTELKKDNWVTKFGEFLLPDAYEEALEYVYSVTSDEIFNLKKKENEYAFLKAEGLSP